LGHGVICAQFAGYQLGIKRIGIAFEIRNIITVRVGTACVVGRPAIGRDCDARAATEGKAGRQAAFRT